MFPVSKFFLATVLIVATAQSTTLDCSQVSSRAAPHPTDCTRYYECLYGMMYPRNCPEGQIFDINSLTCAETGTSVCADDGNNNNNSNNQQEGNRDLVIVFDATGSMATDLAQLRAAAIEIVSELAAKEDDPIDNFVLSVFRDPAVEPVFVSNDSSALISELNKIRLISNFDCPELGMLGLKNAVEVAAPYSVAFLFSDASAKDYELYDEVVQIVQRKQIRVYFLLTGNCGQPNSPEALVYGNIAFASDGQVFNMKNSEVKDVTVGLSFMLDTKYEALRSFDFDGSGENVVSLSVDGSFETLLISATGKNSKLRILDSNNQTVAVSTSVSLANTNIVTFEVTDYEYLIESSAQSEYSIRVGGISDMSFNFGFSIKPTLHFNATQKLPIVGKQNILTVFVTNPEKLKNLRSVSLVSALDSSRSIEIPLVKAESGVYATALIDVPETMFKIKIYGEDNGDRTIERLISTGIEVKRQAVDCSLLSSGVASHPTDCTKYYECVIGIQYEKTCPEGQAFDIHVLTCGDIETSLCAH